MRQVFPTWPDFIQSGFIRTSPDLCSREADGDRCSWAVGGGVLSLRDCIRLMNCRAGWKLSMLSRAWSVSRLTREVAALIDTNTDQWLKKKKKRQAQFQNVVIFGEKEKQIGLTGIPGVWNNCFPRSPNRPPGLLWLTGLPERSIRI